jgi:hypothetical protein
MKANPPPPSYAVAMEIQHQQIQPVEVDNENIEPPSYQESSRTEDIEPNDTNNTTRAQPAATQVGS